MKDSSEITPKWYVLPAPQIDKANSTLFDLDEEEWKKRFQQIFRNSLEGLPEVQTVEYVGGKMPFKHKHHPEKSGYLLVVEGEIPVRLATPEKAGVLHPMQQYAESNFAKLIRELDRGMTIPDADLQGLNVISLKGSALGGVGPPLHPASPANLPAQEASTMPFSRQAFPWITPTSEHVVQSAKFGVDVDLKLDQAPDVEGIISLPQDDRTYDIEVHLLLEDQSYWKTLQFNWAQQTTAPARFLGLTAPDYQRTAEQPDFRTIRVNFYLNHRWCGEGLKNIEILPQLGAPEAPEIPKPPVPEWRRLLNVASDGCVPPDLLVRIQKRTSSKYQWSFLSPHKNFQTIPPEDCEMELESGAQEFVKSYFDELTNIKLGEMAMADLEGTFKEIYRTTAKAFKDVYWQLYWAAKSDTKIKLDTIQFVTDEPYIPWEIMRLEDPVRAPGVDGEILSVRHSVGRWLASESSQLRSRISLRDMAVFASDYSAVDTVDTKLQWAEQEAQDLVGLYQGVGNPQATRYRLVSAEVLKFLKTGKAQALHFSCHGSMDQQTPNASVLILEDDNKNFRPPVVTIQEIQRGIGGQHPLVFLNACQVGGTGHDLRFVTGWPQAFLVMGASAVIAPLWSVGDESARTIAEEFYKFVIGHSPVSMGVALQNIRKQFKDKQQMTYLAYLLYGDPNIQISVV
jgi:hypothetical protein